MPSHELTWFTSSHSSGGSESSDCVEVAFTPHLTAVRDSKAPANGHLALPLPSWRAFLSTLATMNLRVSSS
ncbi:MAG: hypothetical protein QOI21_3682 [Actinomycetota bacterium]|jgi:hypothetical protein|nr:hypothetical protein [Actinomycetota bacterium]